MKRFSVLLILFAVSFSVLFLPGLSYTQKADGAGDKTLSPYFFVKSDDPKLDQLPLKSTAAIANISGVIADVTVTQIYKNEGKIALEAIYVFPASTRAAVYGMKMAIGKRVIEAKIKKRDEARKDYEDAKKQGKGASLLEQQRPNVFQMNVANIMPGDEVRVELKYTELLTPTDNIYEFVYPTVVGPRYSNKPAEAASPSDKWAKNPYLHTGEKAPYSFDIRVNISAGMPINDISSPSHEIKTSFTSPKTAKVTFASDDKTGGNKDYILRYRLAGAKIQSGLLLYQGDKENFFLYMLEPPKKVKASQIPGREYIFVVDVSGSMWGFPLDISKKLLKDLIGNLRPTDTFNVLLFSGGSRLMAEKSVPATQENINNAIHMLEKQQGGGGTELLPALKRALNLPKNEKFSRSIIIATDGYVMVEEEVFDLIRNGLNDANVFSFGIGTSVNRHIIEGMAHVGMGEPFIITKPVDASAKAARFREMIESPVLTKVKVSFQGFSAYDVEPPAVPDVLSDRPVIIFGKWKGNPRGTISVTGISGKNTFSESFDIASTKPSRDNSALRYLWARHRITLLSDYNKLHSTDERVKQVTDLGLTYNLLTAYTSFIAVDSQVRNADGTYTTVNQPLPLPEGVPDYAVGGSMKIARLPSAAAQYSFGHNKGEMYVSEPAPLKDTGKSRTGARGDTSLVASLGEITVSGGIGAQSAAATIKAGFHTIETCFGGSRDISQFVIKIIVNADGTVKEVSIIKGAQNSAVQKCMKRAVETLQFTPTTDGKEAIVTAAINLK